MLKKIDQSIKDFLLKIENNATEINNVPLFIRDDEDFIIEALQLNSLVAKFLKKEDLNKDRIALIISLIIENHKIFIKDKLQEEDFYFNYISQKIKNGEIENKETYINKEYFSKEENVIKVINNVGYFKLKVLNDNLRDQEHIVHLFCKNLKINQIWASNRIKEAAQEGGVEVFQYVNSKLLYEKMGQKFPNKNKTKSTKI